MEGYLALIKEQREENEQLKAQLQQKENIIKEVHKTLEENYGGLPIVEYERLIDLTNGSDKE